MNISAIPHDRKSWGASPRSTRARPGRGRPQAAQDGRVFEDVVHRRHRHLRGGARRAADVDLAVAAARGSRGGRLAPKPGAQAHRKRFAEAIRADTARLMLETRDVNKPIGNSVAVDAPTARTASVLRRVRRQALREVAHRAG
jgi:hypothetical protein